MIGLWRRESPIWRLAWAHRLKGGGESGEPVWATASGNPLTFNAVSAAMQALRVDFSPVQAGSGQPSPGNVRPISGWTGMTALVNGSAKSVSWESDAGTVYGGYVDLISGELVAQHMMVNLSSLSWRLRNSSVPYIFSASFSDAYLTDGVSAEEQLCNLFPVKYVSGWSSADAGYCNLYRYGPSTPSSDLVYLAFDDISTVEDLTAWLNTHNVQVCYRLKTPASYQLSPQVIRTIRGSNTIITDGDAASVTFVEAWQ